MKYLFLLGSVLRSWFTKQRKFVISAMLMFFFSSILMLFAAASLGNEVLFTREEEAEVAGWFCSYTSEELVSENLIPANDHILDTLFSSKSNSIVSIEMYIANVSNEKVTTSTKENSTLEIMPIYKKAYDDKNFMIELWGEKMSSDFMIGGYFYSPQQKIKEGSEITEQDIEEGNNVIVLPEKYGARVGETITLFGDEFSVVGITKEEYAIIPSCFLDKFSLNGDKLLYLISVIHFNEPITEETFQALNQAIYDTTGKEIAAIDGLELPDTPKLAYIVLMTILGGIIAVFSIFGIYYPTLRLCKETLPFISVLKLCGMRIIPCYGLMLLPVFICLSVSFGLASVVLILSQNIFEECLRSFDIRGLFFGMSAFVFIVTAIIAMTPPLLKVAKSQPAEEVEI